jgi:hypothetical protein
MTISTYTELKAAVADYMNRSDLTSQIVDFITMAEGDINTVSRLIHQETTATVTIVAGQDYNTLPTGFQEAIDFYYSDTLEKLEQIPFGKLNDYRLLSSSTTRPEYYAVSDKIYYEATPDAGYTAKMAYLKKWDIASDSTNWLLTNHPAAYLYGALVHAEPFLANDARIVTWKAMWQDKLDMLNRLSAKNRGNAKLGVDVGMVTGRYNIYTDC